MSQVAARRCSAKKYSWKFHKIYRETPIFIMNADWNSTTCTQNKPSSGSVL